ncbi:MAG: hypothetical protein WC498_03625 [Candidatus Saccharimonadales bacterium]
MKLLRKYKLALTISAAIMIVALLPLFHIGAADNIATAPAQVIVGQAVVTDQGVQVSWLASQPGTYPIQSYAVESDRQGAGFQVLDRVSGDSLTYLDADGKVGDSYRIIAEDGQDPANASPASDVAVAVSQQPGDTVAVAPPADTAGSPGTVAITDQATNTAPDSSRTMSTDMQVANFNTMAAQATKTLDVILDSSDKKDDSASAGLLSGLQRSHQQILNGIDQLTPIQKRSVVQSCTQQLMVLEPDFYVLPESGQLDGLLALAGCEAIQSTAQ